MALKSVSLHSKAVMLTAILCIYSNKHNFGTGYVIGSVHMFHIFGLILQNWSLNAHTCCLRFNSVNVCISKVLVCRQLYHLIHRDDKYRVEQNGFPEFNAEQRSSCVIGC